MDGCCGACVGGCTFCSRPRTWHFTHLLGSIFLDQIFDPRHTVIVISSKQRDWWAEFGGSLISCLPHFDLMQSDQKQSTSFTLKRVPPSSTRVPPLRQLQKPRRPTVKRHRKSTPTHEAPRYRQLTGEAIAQRSLHPPPPISRFCDLLITQVLSPRRANG